MVHQCDFCKVEEATVFCFADQAVLCSACDRRVHGANKIVKKHERVSLQKENDTATCDICQENKAVMFCSEDRALICRRCDVMIHTANEYVAKHHRYLLSGVAIGLKSIDGKSTTSEAGDKGASKKPYGLRNTNGGASSSSYEHQDRLPQDRLGGSTGAAKARGGGDDAGIGMGTMRQQSQASLIDMREGAGAMGGLPQQAGSSLMTPFGNQEEQQFRGEDAAGGGYSQNPGDGAGPSNRSWSGVKGWGFGLDLGRPDSSDFTLAAELLGLPAVSQGFTAKDIDAAYIFDDDCDLDASLSALLEVPSLDFSQFDAPVTTTTHSNANGLGQPQARSTLNVGNYVGPSNDGMVPDFKQKRQRSE